MSKRWTKEEEKVFIELYPTVPTNDLVLMLNRSKTSLVTKANKLNIKKVIRADGLRYIYEDEKNCILEFSKTHSIPEIERKFGRDYNDIQKILIENNYIIIPSERQWTKEQELFLVENFYKESPDYISNILNKKWRTITKKAREMGMKRINKKGMPHKTPTQLSFEEEIFIKNNYKNMGVWDISKILDRSTGLIIKFCKNNHLNILKLRKNPINYSNEFLLFELKRMSLDLKRCPTSGEIQRNLDLPSVDIYYDRFGTFSNACELAGLEINMGSYGTLCYSKNNDKCYSIQEQIITDYLIDKNIKYIKEFEYYNIIPDIDCNIVMDWYINNVVVEYFGLQRIETYKLKTKMKQEICKKNNIKIISIFPEDMKYLDRIFHEFINETP